MARFFFIAYISCFIGVFTTFKSVFIHSNIRIYEWRIFVSNNFSVFFLFLWFDCYYVVKMWLMILLLQHQLIIHFFCFFCRKNVSGSRPKPNSGVHIHVLQRKAHWLAARPHSLGQSLQSWKRCGMHHDRYSIWLHSKSVSACFLFLSAETLRASEVQPPHKIQAFLVSTRGPSFIPCWKDPKADRESCASQLIVCSKSWGCFIKTIIGFSVCTL